MTSCSQGQSVNPEGWEAGRLPGSQGLELTVIQCPLQDWRAAGAAIPDACEGQHLDLVEHVLAQACELGAEGRVAFHQPDPGLGVRVLLFIHHLLERSAG